MGGCIFAGLRDTARMNWDDIRVVRAVSKTGSYTGAARILRINETTVPRRLARLEKDLGVTLFEAVDGTRRPTARCEEILALSETMARQAEKISSVVDTGSRSIERRRIAATDSVTAELLAPHAAAFLAEHPAIALDFLVSTENVDFSRWEADIAIRLKRPDKGDFIVSKLMESNLFLVEPLHGLSRDEQIVCAYPDDLDNTPESRHLASLGLLRQARCRTKNLVVLRRLIESGNVVGVLPSYMCAEFATNERLQFTRLPQRRSVWLLVQRHLKNDGTTRLVIDWIKSCFASVQAES